MTFSPIEADVGGLLTKVINTVERTSNEVSISSFYVLSGSKKYKKYPGKGIFSTQRIYLYYTNISSQIFLKKWVTNSSEDANVLEN